jgi:hypothetical protein
MTLLVTVYFWLVELPCMGARGDYYEMSLSTAIALYCDHTLPIIAMTLDWVHNSIVV